VSDVKHTSSRVPTGTRGTVIDVQVFTRDGIEKDQRAKSIEKEQLDQYRKDLKDEYRIVEGATFERLLNALKGQSVISGPGLKKGASLEEGYLLELPRSDWFKLRMQDESLT
jgi:DNA-directed RNA polymerase subunit beta